jgi:DNA-binding MarR family transcriptional regulator
MAGAAPVGSDSLALWLGATPQPAKAITTSTIQDPMAAAPGRLTSLPAVRIAGNLGKVLVNVKSGRIGPVSTPYLSQAERTVPALVQLLARSSTDRLRADFAEQGMAGLRPLHALLLIPLLGGGRHASDLAETLGVSRQAVAQVVTRLEGDGYLTRIADPGDARARLICLTPRGRAALRTMRTSARALEDDWRDRLGAERLAAFRDTLLTLLSATP